MKKFVKLFVPSSLSMNGTRNVININIAQCASDACPIYLLTVIVDLTTLVL